MRSPVPDSESLWRIDGQGLVLATLVAGDAEVHLEPGFAVGLHGEPHPELNYAVISAAAGAEDRLREYVSLLRKRGAGGYVNLSQAVATRLEPVALELGLELEMVTPLMAQANRPDALGQRPLRRRGSRRRSRPSPRRPGDCRGL